MTWSEMEKKRRKKINTKGTLEGGLFIKPDDDFSSSRTHVKINSLPLMKLTFAYVHIFIYIYLFFFFFARYEKFPSEYLMTHSGESERWR